MIVQAGSSVLSARLPAVGTLLSPLRSRVRGWLADNAVPSDLRDDVVLAADEALVNAVEHGYRHDRQPGPIELTIRLTLDQIVLDVVDHGSWKPPVVKGGNSRGRGLKIIQSLAGQVNVTHTDSGTALTARFPRTS